MNRRATGAALITGALLSGLAAAQAWADVGPLLVVVEAPPELSVDAGEIRRAIGAELRDATVAPARLVSQTSDRALIVSVDRERITMSLRDSATTRVIRTIPAPADREARLHAIAWLAGNLARDQVSGIVAETAPPASALANMPALAPAATPPAAASVAATGTQPPPYQPGAAPVLATQAEPTAASPPSRWFVSLEAGLVTGVYYVIEHGFRNTGRGANDAFSRLWRFELRRFSNDQRFLVGVSAEGVAGAYDPERFGAAGFCGWKRRRGRWAIEGTLGLGLDIGNRYSSPNYTTTTTTSSTTGFTTSTTVTDSLAGGVYGLAAAAVSHRISESANLFLRVGAHVSTVEVNDVFIWTALGLSYGLW